MVDVLGLVDIDLDSLTEVPRCRAVSGLADTPLGCV